MNNYSVLTMCVLLASTLSSVQAEPTRTFFFETPEISAVGLVSIDIEYPFLSGGTTFGQASATSLDVSGTTGGTSASIRIGTENGELFLNNTRTNLITTSIGFKGAIKENIAIFSTLSHSNFEATNSSFTEFSVGITSAIKMETLTLTANTELIIDSSSTSGSDHILFVTGAIKYPTNNLLENSSVIAELRLDDNSAVETFITAGLRWQPTKRLTADLIVYSKQGNSIVAIPGYVILNFAF